MLPSDEKVPAPNMSSSIESNRGSMTPLQNPLHDIYREHLEPKNSSTVNQPPGSAAQPYTPIPSAGQQTPSVPQLSLNQSRTTAQNDSDDEAIWMQRAKTVVEQTQNDPYRRLQMIQQLQAQYQSEHFRKDTGGVSGS